jgi:basic membrane lipoprotein Med (substrate-binding protein (PBP1-ABC) superfamily)
VTWLAAARRDSRAAARHDGRVRATAAWTTGTAIAVLCLTGCGGSGHADESTSAAASSRLPAGCDDVSNAVHQEDCLDSVQQKLQADTVAYANGATVTHAAFQQAYTPLAAAWSDLAVAHSVAVDTSHADVQSDDATTPVSTTWTLATTKRTLWVCFHGSTVSVQTTRCS